ncbi:MAG: DNA gyrase subunit A, partial [Erysipelotrichaceae bacterium]|nr:DNA gyrase subunit A [Erysipelotrichaceae bacterium]
PTAGIILGRQGIKDAYETGTGSITIRSKAHIETMANGKRRIIVTEIPYGVNKASMIEDMGRLVHEKIIDGITDIRDESNKEGVRVVIEVRRDVVAEVILNQLYKNTQLQTSFGIIMLALDNGVPKIMSITEILKKYLDHQCDVIERRTRFDLNKALDRLHILEGLLKAIDNIDEVIHIIRNSRTQDIAKNQLMERFDLSEPQTKAILDMRLARLTGLERDSICAEIDQLNVQIARFKEILSSKENVLEVVITELEEIKEKYGDDRRTEISDDLSSIDDEDLIPEEDIIITLTSSGYIKRQDPESFRLQKRGGKGVKGMSTHEDDIVEKIIYAKTHIDLLFFTNLGKVYRLRGYQIPEFAKSSKGTPVVNLLNLDDNEKVMSIISCSGYDDEHFVFFATKEGIVKRTSLKEFALIRQTGKYAITMKENDELLDVKLTDGNTLICISADNGKMVKFNEQDVRVMGRTAAGVRGISLEENERAVGLNTSLEGKYILSITEHGYGKKTPLEEYRLTQRGAKGVTTINMTDKTGKLVTTRAVDGDEDVMVVTKAGIIIRTSLNEVNVVGRNTQGVKIIRINDKEAVASIAVVKAEEVEENLPTEAENDLNEGEKQDNKE